MPERDLPPHRRLRPGRRIRGMSAILLPFRSDGTVDWDAFAAHVRRTHEAGLTPAVNMDTGYAQLLDPEAKERALELAGDATGGDFVAGALVADAPGDPFRLERLAPELEAVRRRGGTPVVFPSYGLRDLSDAGWVDAHREVARACDRFIAFELGPVFAPTGRIRGPEAYVDLLGVEACLGAKHSSLSRRLEWERLGLRDRLRPDFLVLTGNDLAIDMVMYGSDYLLGLSTFAPDLFARRDRLWEAEDPGFYELNDVLQYLGFFAFRDPVPAYKHDAAMFLHLRGWIASDLTHSGAPGRPDWDREVLREIAARLEVLPA